LALQLHSPDVELALVRSYMQAGDYRRALAFCAHTAGAHREIGAGAALYAWLLQMGGQAARAHEVLEAALKLSPEDADLLEARAALAQPWPQPGPRLMRAPQRFAPYAWGAPADDPPPSAAVVGTATLSADGRHAFVPAAMLQGPGHVWLRNGLGQTVTAERASTEAPAGVAVLDLRSPLPPSAGLAQAPREPFAGAPAYVAEYANRPGPEALPAWPTLRVGFFGRPLLARGERLLGVELPSGGRGGPVFDAQGRWAGIAFLGADGRDRMISALELAPIGGQVNSATGPTAALPWDAVYEIAQRMSLQVLRPTGESTLR
jgi:tetratricopeptide (TPR) repeat protein